MFSVADRKKVSDSAGIRPIWTSRSNWAAIRRSARRFSCATRACSEGWMAACTLFPCRAKGIRGPSRRPLAKPYQHPLPYAMAASISAAKMDTYTCSVRMVAPHCQPMISISSKRAVPWRTSMLRPSSTGIQTTGTSKTRIPMTRAFDHPLRSSGCAGMRARSNTCPCAAADGCIRTRQKGRSLLSSRKPAGCCGDSTGPACICRSLRRSTTAGREENTSWYHKPG